jgi:hypothetical protein
VADEPDLSAELDDADLIVTGGVAEVRTEWGVRYTDDEGYSHVAVYYAETAARFNALPRNLNGTVKRRKIIVGDWEDA